MFEVQHKISHFMTNSKHFINVVNVTKFWPFFPDKICIEIRSYEFQYKLEVKKNPDDIHKMITFLPRKYSSLLSTL